MHAHPAATAPPAQQGSPPPDSGSPPAPAPRRRSFSYRPRRSTLSAGQRDTWDRLWPVYGMDAYRPDSTPAGPVDAAAWFGRKAPLVLEIGSGTGTSTVAMAQVEPEIDVIAVEVYGRGLAQLLCAIDRERLTNIRLIRGDAADVLDHLIPPGSLTGVRVFFPDPWPKARHHKRRLLQPATMAVIADRLRPGGVLHAATDHADYAVHIAAAGDGEPALRRITRRPGLPMSVDRPTTKYETKAEQAGSAVTELLWERR